ncbi:MAG: hypothetical protein Q8O55_01790 [Dehalococcoidales bacterium]|nr:hypothetical protein [Dehalococcoidales bacterium]
MNRNIAIAGAGLTIVGAILLAKKAGGSGPGSPPACFLAKADKWYYVTWTGSPTYLPDAFGPVAWSVIWAVETKVEGNWEAPGDPSNFVVKNNDSFRFMVSEDVDVCL